MTDYISGSSSPSKLGRGSNPTRQVTVARIHRRPVLRVTVLKAVGVASKDDNGLSDPYCKITLRGKTVQTKIQFETLNPVWNETFELQPGSESDELRFQCWDYDEGTLPDFLGYHNVSLSKVFEKLQTQETVTEVYPLLARSTDSDITGELHIQYQSRALESADNEKAAKLEQRFEKFLVDSELSDIEKVSLRELNLDAKKQRLKEATEKKAKEFVSALSGKQELPEKFLENLRNYFGEPHSVKTFARIDGIEALVEFFQKPKIANTKESTARVVILELMRDYLLRNEYSAHILIEPVMIESIVEPIAKSKSSREAIALYSLLSVLPSVTAVFLEIQYDGIKLAQAALAHFQIMAKESQRYSTLVQLLNSSAKEGNSAWTLTAFIMVNAILDSAQLQIRLQVRNELIACDILPAIETVKRQFPLNECIRAQVQEFEEEMAEDEDLFREELAEKIRNTDIKDPVAIVTAIVENKPQHHTRALREMLKCLLLLPSDTTIGLRKFLAIERFTREVATLAPAKELRIENQIIDLDALYKGLNSDVSALQEEEKVEVVNTQLKFELDRLKRRHEEALSEIEKLKASSKSATATSAAPPVDGTPAPPPPPGSVDGPPPPPPPPPPPGMDAPPPPPPPPGMDGPPPPPPPPGMDAPPPPPPPPGMDGPPPPPPPPGMGGPPPPPPPPGMGGPPPPPPPPGMGGPPPPPPPGMGGPPPPPGMGGARPPFGAAPKRTFTVKPSKDMRPFRWNKLPGPREKKASVFQELKPEKVELDFAKLETMFEQVKKKPSVIRAPNANGSGQEAPEKKTKASLIDPKRAQSINIFLKRMTNDKTIQKKTKDKKSPDDDDGEKGKEFSDVIKEAILACDMELLSEEITDMLLKNLPTSEDFNAINAWLDANPDKDPRTELDAPELYFIDLKSLPEIAERLEVLRFHQTVKSSLESVSTPIMVIKEATESLKESKSFPKLLEFALAVGNFLNFGTRLGNVFSISLETLLSLKDTKSTTSKANLLDYLVEFISAKHPDVLNWPDSIRHLKRASEAAWDQQETKLSVLKAEAEKALGQANGVTVLETGDEFGKIVLYVQEHKRDVSELVELKESTYNSWKSLAESYGTDCGDTKPDDFFKLLNTFAADFNAAAKSLQAEREKEDEKKRKEDEKARVELKRQEIADRKKSLDARKRAISGNSSGSESNSPALARPLRAADNALRRSTPGGRTTAKDKKSDEEAESVLNDMLGQLVTGRSKGVALPGMAKGLSKGRRGNITS